MRLARQGSGVSSAASLPIVSCKDPAPERQRGNDVPCQNLAAQLVNRDDGVVSLQVWHFFSAVPSRSGPAGGQDDAAGNAWRRAYALRHRRTGPQQRT